MNFKFPKDPNEEFWMKTGGEFQSGPRKPREPENTEETGKTEEKKKSKDS